MGTLSRASCPTRHCSVTRLVDFLKLLLTNFRTEVAQILYDFLERLNF